MASDHKPQASGHAFLPAAGWHCLTACYDLLCAVAGLGPRFKARVMDTAAVAERARVLDVGCGTGVLAVLLKRQGGGRTVVAMDIDSHILKLASRNAAKGHAPGIHFLCASAHRIPFQTGFFDGVFSTLAFHHLAPSAKAAAVVEIVRVLRPGGQFFLVDLQPLFRRRHKLTAEELLSPDHGFATNRVEDIAEALASAGLEVRREPPPARSAFRPWMFALRATKPAAGRP
jgi:ubiquinone/menaquinone biosynthesis C-methylase UbiE